MLTAPVSERDPIVRDTASIAVSRAGAPIDPNGNLTSNGLTGYSWNARNQLSGIDGGTSGSFAYDAVGRRRAKTISGTSTNFLYNGVNLVQELAGSTSTANLLTGLGIDETFARTDAGGMSTLLTDALGSAWALANASGTAQTQYTYEPFGLTTASGAASPNVLQFTGRENDATGLYYYRARYLNPQTSSFVSEDERGLSSGTDLYTYAWNSPANHRDPTGLTPGDNGLEGDVHHLRNIFPDSKWDPAANTLVIHLPCPRVIPILKAQGYQNANSWGYNGPGSAFWNPVGHPGGFEWRTFGPGFHFRMQYPSSCGEPNCTLDQFHVDDYNPIEPGQFLRHVQCDFLHLCGK